MRTYILGIGNNTVCTSQLLLEWGADIYIKNKMSKTAMELIRNSDLKTFLEGNVLMVQIMYIEVFSVTCPQTTHTYITSSITGMPSRK